MAATSGSMLGTTIGERYTVEESIGFGGWGIVYRGKDLFLGREVAVKILHRPTEANPYLVDRFLSEAKLMSQVQHKSIAAIFDYGVLPSQQPYMIMEYLVGETLADKLKRKGYLSPEAAAQIFSQICEALAAAHEKGIVHRDLKPSNIFLVADSSSVKLLDFGLAKFTQDSEEISQLTKTGDTMGSPAYMSPEQCRGAKLDARSDLYSLCCSLYETLSGKKVFSGNAFACMNGHLNQKPIPLKQRSPKLKLSTSLDQFLQKGLRKNPADRFQSATELNEALCAAVSGKYSPAKKISFFWTKTIAAQVLGLVLVVVVMALISQSVTRQLTEIPKPPAPSSEPSSPEVPPTLETPTNESPAVIGARLMAPIINRLGKLDPQIKQSLTEEVGKLSAMIAPYPGIEPTNAIILGRLAGPEASRPKQLSQTPELIGDYFIANAKSGATKVPLFAHGYEPVTVRVQPLLVNAVTWVGDVEFKPLSSETAGRIKGRVTWGKGVPASNVNVSVVPAAEIARAADSWRFQYLGEVFLHPAANGTFQVGNCTAGEYMVTVDSPGHWYEQRRKNVKEGSLTDFGTIDLNIMSQIRLDYKVADTPDFGEVKAYQQTHRADEEFSFFEHVPPPKEDLPHTLTIEKDTETGSYFARLHAIEAYISDLGPMDKLPNTVENASFLVYREFDSERLVPGHVYIFRIMKEPGGDRRKYYWIVFKLNELTK